MHDLYISRLIAQEVIKRAKREGASRVLEVRIKIGNFTHLNPEQLDFWLKEFFRSTLAQEAKILIKKVPTIILCRKCGYKSKLENADVYFPYFSLPFLQCPHCGSNNTELVSGKECLLERIKIEKRDKG